MNPYLLTITFLTLMGIVTSSELTRFLGSYKESLFHQQALANTFHAEKCRSHALYEDSEGVKLPHITPKDPFKPDREKNRGETLPATLRISRERPPENARLNIHLLLHGDSPKGAPEHFSLYETIAYVMRALYHDAPFFQEIDRAEYRILEALITCREQTTDFKFPDELATLIFDDKPAQKVFYHMLKGPPSLLHYLTFEKSQRNASKLNFLFVDPLIIEAVFPDDPRLVETLCAYKEKFLDEIFYRNENRREFMGENWQNRTTLSTRLNRDFSQMLEDVGYDPEAYKKIFDLKIGTKGKTLFIHDDQTGLTTREIHPKYL